MAELSFPDPPLTDGVVVLRPWEPGDVAFVVRAALDPEVLRSAPALPVPFTNDDAIAWFARHQPRRLAGTGLDFAVALVANSELLGHISLNKVSEPLASASVGYWLVREARGHGYASRGLRLLAGWAFASLALARLELTTDAENFASQRVAERCGFERESLPRIAQSGESRDSLVFGLLPDHLVRE